MDVVDRIHKHTDELSSLAHKPSPKKGDDSVALWTLECGELFYSALQPGAATITLRGVNRVVVVVPGLSPSTRTRSSPSSVRYGTSCRYLGFPGCG
jgi:hypothetical protein